MPVEIKSGRELLDEFFTTITDIEGVDREIADIVKNLYLEGKLTDKSLSNELERVRKEWLYED